MTEPRKHELDFIKGFAILSVILLHTLSRSMLYEIYAYFHIWQAVPLFVFVSYYLFFVRLGQTSNVSFYFSRTNIKKVIRRVIIPFTIIELLVIIVNELFSFPISALSIIRNLGIGPGSYYPYIYIQLWVSAPFIFVLLRKIKYGGVILLLMCVVLNIVACHYVSYDRIYSFLFIRYLFIAFLAYQWYKKDIKICLLFSVVSIIYYFLVIKCDINFAPWIDNRWELQQFPAFFYTLLLFAFLYKSYPYLNLRFGKVMKFVERLGRYSYEIFLLQMFFLTYLVYDNTFLVHWGLLGKIAFVSIILFLSIVPVFIYKTIYEKYSNNSCAWRK